VLNKKLVVDAFPAFNEIRLAEFRISYLSETVDLVVIAEAWLTQSGLPKPLYFKDWIEAQGIEMKSRVMVVEVPLLDLETSWEREIFTREYLCDYLKREYPNSKFILSDLDEIPSIQQVKQLHNSHGIFHFHTPTFVRNVNWQLQDQHQNWARGVMGETDLNIYPNGGRFVKEFPRIDSVPGAHFSWLQIDKDSITKKLQAAAHVELNESFWSSKSLMRYCDRYKIDHLGRSRAKGFGVLKICYPLPEGILLEISKVFPNLVDLGTETPKLGTRLLASCKFSAFVGDNSFSRKVRSHFDPEYYFSHHSTLIYSVTLIEVLVSTIAMVKRLIKRLRLHRS
jgi:hypothetical protein